MINIPNNWNFLNEKENWCGHFFFQDKNSSFIDTFLNKYTKKFPYQNTISLIGDCIEHKSGAFSNALALSQA